jgi:hypothetical protein
LFGERFAHFFKLEGFDDGGDLLHALNSKRAKKRKLYHGAPATGLSSLQGPALPPSFPL